MPHALPENGKIRTAVLTGGHPFQVPPFQEMFRALPEVDAYPQSLDEFTADAAMAGAYDVVLFYTMYRMKPDDELPWYQKNLFKTIEALGRREQGLFVLHHSLVAFPEWPLWTELMGIAERTTIAPHFDQTLTVDVVDRDHPITRDLPPRWTLHDETYTMADAAPENGNHVLLATDHSPSMRTLAWTRAFRDSRVFCYQSGHDHHAFDDPTFRQVIGNAIRWLARREPDGR